MQVSVTMQLPEESVKAVGGDKGGGEGGSEGGGGVVGGGE